MLRCNSTNASAYIGLHRPAPSSVISRPTCFSSSLRCCLQVGSAPFVLRRCDCLASSAPFTNIQTYLLTYLLDPLKMSTTKEDPLPSRITEDRENYTRYLVFQTTKRSLLSFQSMISTVNCSPAWSGLCRATERARLNAFLRRSKRSGYCSENTPNINELFDEADKSVLTDNRHVLHPLLPARTQNRHGLRHRRHDRELSTKTAQLDESNFFNRNVV